MVDDMAKARALKGWKNSLKLSQIANPSQGLHGWQGPSANDEMRVTRGMMWSGGKAKRPTERCWYAVTER